MDVEDASGAAWRECVRRAGSIERDREALGRLVDEDQDDAEISYYETASDPGVRAINRAQRSYAGQYERHLRRLISRARHRSSDERSSERGATAG